MNRTLLTAVAAGCFTLLAAQERFDLKVRNYFFAGFAGDAESLAKGMKMSEETLLSDPQNAEALVWHGSGLYYQAGQFFQKGDARKGLELFQKGIEEMDQAVALAPDSVAVRIPRGGVLLTGSRFMPDQAQARPLVERAVSDYERSYEVQSGSIDKLATHPRGELLIGLAEGYARLGNAEKSRAFYERIEREMPDTAYARKAAKYRETGVAQTGCLGCHVNK